jgi:hypothetical protein
LTFTPLELVDRKGQGRRDHATANAARQVAATRNTSQRPGFARLLSLPLLESMPRFFEIIFTAQ